MAGRWGHVSGIWLETSGVICANPVSLKPMIYLQVEGDVAIRSSRNIGFTPPSPANASVLYVTSYRMTYFSESRIRRVREETWSSLLEKRGVRAREYQSFHARELYVTFQCQSSPMGSYLDWYLNAVGLHGAGTEFISLGYYVSFFSHSMVPTGDLFPNPHAFLRQRTTSLLPMTC